MVLYRFSRMPDLRCCLEPLKPPFECLAIRPVAIGVGKNKPDAMQVLEPVSKHGTIQENHVHLIIQTAPKDSPADGVQRLKGGTSRVMRQEYPELEEFRKR